MRRRRRRRRRRNEGERRSGLVKRGIRDERE